VSHSPLTLEIEDLEIWCHLGVSAQERAWQQKILVSVTFPVSLPSQDDIKATTDYMEIVNCIRKEANRYPRQLLETLAKDLCDSLTTNFGITPTRIKIKKFAIPSASAVVVHYVPQANL